MKNITISDFANDLIEGINKLNNLLEDNKPKIIKRKIRVKGKFKYQILVRHNILLDTFPLYYYYSALRLLRKNLKESD